MDVEIKVAEIKNVFPTTIKGQKCIAVTIDEFLDPERVLCNIFDQIGSNKFFEFGEKNKTIRSEFDNKLGS